MTSNDQRDKIYLNQLAFYGYHGLFPEEKKLGQRFVVDIVLYLDISVAGNSGHMHDSVHYGEVFEVVEQIVEGASIDLIEELTEKIARLILAKFSLVEALTVKVTKPDPPINGHYASVAVEIYREREAHDSH